MKKFLTATTLIFSFGLLSAQESKTLGLNVYGAYIFQDKINFDGSYGYAKEGFQYGAGVEYYIISTVALEVKYLRQDTRFPLYTPNGEQVNEGKDKGSINYILIGGTNYFEKNAESKIVPYLGTSIGAGILDTKDGGSSTKFAFDASLGLKIRTSSNISFKLHATIQSITSTFGSDFYNTGSGVIALPDYASLFQFGLGGGVFFSFDK